MPIQLTDVSLNIMKTSWLCAAIGLTEGVLIGSLYKHNIIASAGLYAPLVGLATLMPAFLMISAICKKFPAKYAPMAAANLLSVLPTVLGCGFIELPNSFAYVTVPTLAGLALLNCLLVCFSNKQRVEDIFISYFHATIPGIGSSLLDTQEPATPDRDTTSPRSRTTSSLSHSNTGASVN